MAPEQARGKPVDKRADIWAFGCLFYEVLSGRRLFDGVTASDTLAAVLTGDIDLDRVPAPLPPLVRQLLARCLDRDTRTRLRDIGEARVALQGLDKPLAEHAAPSGHRIGGRLVWAVTIGLACVVIALLWQRASRQHPAAPPYRFTISTPAMFDLADFAVSPDGRSLAFVALVDSKMPSVWIRPFAGADGRVLPESKTNQQDTEPCEICKTSIPGSNPGGTSNHKSLKHQHLQSECFWLNFCRRCVLARSFGRRSKEPPASAYASIPRGTACGDGLWTFSHRSDAEYRNVDDPTPAGQQGGPASQ
jgi:serine/threonine protein kinase